MQWEGKDGGRARHAYSWEFGYYPVAKGRSDQLYNVPVFLFPAAVPSPHLYSSQHVCLSFPPNESIEIGALIYLSRHVSTSFGEKAPDPLYTLK